MNTTLKVLSEQVNIPDVEREAREQWEKELRKRRRLEVWIVRNIPFAIVLMGAAFYGLSAPHTANILNLITPGWGNFAPIGWEMGILSISALREAGIRNWLTLSLLWGLIIMSMMINVVGGFLAVVTLGNQALNSSLDISSMTFQQLTQQFGNIPATFQAALFLVIPLGIAIPLIAAVIGEIVIKLAMRTIRFERETDEQRWRKEASGVMYNALFNTAIKLGATPRTAGNWSQVIVEQMYIIAHVNTDAIGQQGADGQLSAQTGHAIASRGANKPPIGFIQPQQYSADSGRTADGRGQHGHGSGYDRKSYASQLVRQHLEEYPEDMHMTVRDLATKIGVGKTTVADVMKEMKR